MSPPSLRRRCTWLVLIVSLALNLLFIATRGAWTSDLAGDPDEAAHAVTSLMVRDFVAEGWRQPPLKFAQRFYADFPKVALGHYPPGFYMLAGLWLLPAVSVKSLLLLQAALASCLAALVFRLASKFASLPASILAGLLMALLPVSLKQVQIVMSDTLVALLCLSAVVLWRDYMNRPSMRRAAGFGLLAAAAILTKGTAMGLCVLPPLATALTGRWQLLKTPSWWFSALPVAVLAGPWMFYSTQITAEGMTHRPLSEFVPEAAAYYGRALPQVLGWLLAILALVGVIRLLVMSRTSAGAAALAASLSAMAAGMLLIILVVPAGLNERYLLPVLPVLLVGAVLVADRLCAPLANFRWVALAMVTAGGLLLVGGWPTKEVHGFSLAVSQSGIPASQADAANWLVASDPRGEGAIIAAAAFNCPQRSPSILRVYRGSKELASSDWMGRGYVPAFTDSAQLLDQLDLLKVRRVFVDLSMAENQRKDHERLLEQALGQATERWTLDFEQKITRGPGKNGKLLVYKRL